jgi:hypothetical protein
MALWKARTAAALFVILLAIAVPKPALPITITGTTSADLLVQTLVDSSIVPVAGSAILYGGYDNTNPSMPIYQSAVFGGSTNIGIPSGIILSTGDAVNIQNPNNPVDPEVYRSFFPNSGDFVHDPWGTTNATARVYTSGADALAGVLGLNTIFDPNVLEFQFALGPGAWNLSFSYSFASDEYVNYFGSDFNDAIGFFIDGIDANSNVARLSDGTIVSVNNNSFDPHSVVVVNGSSISLIDGLYRNNIQYWYDSNHAEFGNPPLLVPAGTNQSPSGFDIGLDGLTDILITQSLTLDGGTSLNPIYHTARLVIADVGNGDVDSAVFIRGGSFSATPAIPEPGTLVLLGTGLAAAGLLRRRIR